MKRFILISLLGFLANSACFARLGENSQELIARYGNPIQNVGKFFNMQIYQGKKRGGDIVNFCMDNDKYYVFSSNKIKVRANLDSNDICQYLDFSPSPEKEQILELLEKNSQGHKWSGEQKCEIDGFLVVFGLGMMADMLLISLECSKS